MRVGERVAALAALGPREITSLSDDSRTVTPGALFFALPGDKADGAAFAAQALARGAAAVVSERPPPAGTTAWVQVGDVRAVLAEACRVFYARDVSPMRYAGVTGTNGKTTTTFLVEAIFNADARAAGLLGTVEQRYRAKRWPATHTTLLPIALGERLVEMEALGARWAVMEVSSHALEQKRVDALRFDVAGFTNLTPDHLDYHRTMEAYFAAKARLFTALMAPGGACVVNLDGAYGGEMWARVDKGRRVGVSRLRGADVQCTRVVETREGMTLEVRSPIGGLVLETSLIGAFNVENILVAVGMAIGAGVGAEAIVGGVASLAGVPGRMEKITAPDGRLGFVDYSHTPDALDRALATLKPLPHDQLICVFGCGGDRDRHKRPLMGAAAAKHADLVLVTSDNPRSEPPRAIIDEILPGLLQGGFREVAADALGNERQRFSVIEERREAICRGAKVMGARDILMVAGKGHEDYQIVGSTKLHFDDREEVRAAFGMADAI